MGNMDISVQIGSVNSVNSVERTVKVLHEDANGSISTDLPIMRPKPKPEIGDPILCVYLSNGAAYGICLGEYYQDENTPADNGQFIECMVLPDGSSIQYDTINKKLILNARNIDITVSGGTLNIGSNTTIDGKKFLQHTHSDPQGGQTGPVT